MPGTSPLPDRLLLPLRFDAGRMQADLAGLESGEWMEHFVKQNFEGCWSVIPLRGPEGATHPVMMMYSDPACENFADTPFLTRCGYFPDVLAAFPFPLDAVRLMKLTPGSVTPPWSCTSAPGCCGSVAQSMRR